MMDPLSKMIFYKAGQSYQSPVILMYHSTVAGSKKQAFEFSIDTHRFQRQLDFLQNQGWKTALVKDIKKARQLPAKTVIFTFDDGFKNNYKGAYIPLLEREMCATWFIVSGCIARKSKWLHGKNEQMLSDSDLIEMHLNGMEIGAHTVSHPDLRIIGIEETMKEMEESKQALENIISQKIVSFAYPYGRYTDETVKCVKKAGYDLACSVRSGWVRKETDPFLLPRVTVFAHDSLSTFARKIAFASNDGSWSTIYKYYRNRLMDRIRP